MLLYIQNKGKGKGKGKKSKESLNVQISEEAIAEEAQRRLQLFIASQQTNNAENFQPTSSRGINLPSTSRHSDDLWTNDSSSSHVSNNFSPLTAAPEKKTIYLKRVEVTINGTPIDMIEDKQTEDECIQEIINIIYNT
jgi:hypothetical protein